MDDKNKQNSFETDDPFKPQLHIQPGTKIIQPSAALLEELKSQKPEPPRHPQQVNKPADSGAKNTESATTDKPVLQRSIYPEATRDVDVSAQIAHPAYTRDKLQNKILISPKRIFVIRVVTGFLLFLELISLFVQQSIVHVIHSSVNTIDLLVTLCIIVLFVGILFLIEFARAIYVFVAIASVAIALFGVLTLYVATHKSNVADSKSQQLSRLEIDNSINSTNQNNQYTQEQKDLIVKNLKDQPGYSAVNDAKLKVKRYSLYAFTLLITVAPMVFYTRPKIKEAFS